MSKKTDTKLIGVVILGALAAWYFMNQQRPQYAPQYAAVPPPPPKSSPNYQAWVNSILQVYGQVAELWKPGGPFYKQGIPQNTASLDPGGVYT